MLHSALGVAAALVATAFALSTLDRWLARRRRHDGVWAIALFLFALGAAFLAAGAGTGWNGPLFRGFYLFGAVLNVPWLALGTVYLLGGPRRGDRVGAVLVVLSVIAIGVVCFSPFTGPIPRDELARGSEVFGAWPRLFAGVASGVGALVVIAGALWSAIRGRRVGERIVIANVLIATGTAITGMSGLLNSVADAMTGFAITLLLGIVVIFAGFLVATSGPERLRGALSVRAVPGGDEGAADRDWIAGLVAEHNGGVPWVVSRGQRHDAPSLDAFVAEAGGARVGAATWRDAGDGSWEIVTLDSAVERQGVGRALLDAVADAAQRAGGVRRLWLVTVNSNIAAIGFYQRRGWRLAALHTDAVVAARAIKPEIPEVIDGIEVAHELEFERVLGQFSD